ncbi:MAG TPA: hypothetical protein VE685_17605 [Thermoanaerobaculia bacterium]|nr:hypothetical protein [Thermoanaerobaculia bacterium]
MSTAGWLRAARAVVALPGFLLLAAPLPADSGGWRVLVRGADLTRTAAPVVSGGVLLVDLAALAPILRLTVRTREGALSVRDPEGVEWRGNPGSPLLEAPGRTLALRRPIRLEGRSARLPVEAVAELGGLRLTIDAESRTASLDEGSHPVRTGTLNSGWESFTLAKPPILPEDRPGTSGAGAFRPLLPPGHETLRLGVGIGYVQGRDWGSELTATGSVRGIETGISGLLTSGPRGFELASGHALLSDRDRGWGLEAGDVFSELRGSAQGLRLLRDRSGADGEVTAFSLYLEDLPAGFEDPVLAVSDERGLGGGIRVGGEIASDGSWLAQSRLQTDRLGLFAYFRDTSSRSGDGAGFSGSFEPAPGLILQGSLSRTREGNGSIESRTLSLWLPLRREADLIFEAGQVETAFGSTRSGAAVLVLPAGPVDLRARYHRRESVFRGVLERPVLWEQDEVVLAASWRARSRLLLNVQLAGHRTGSGDPALWGQLQTSWILGRRTALHLHATDGSVGSNLYRLRVEHELLPGLSLQAEYGDVPSFQSLPPSGGPLEDEARFKLTVRRTWEVETPAGGESVEGRIASPLGPLPAGTPVQLGPWRTLTDDVGRFAFRHVPRGRYEISVAEESLPAGYEPGGGRRAVEVAGRGAVEVELPLVPLGEVRGSVYVDRDGDGRRGPGEEVSGVVLLLDGRATASGADGSFGFYNLEPGTHELRIDVGRLPRGLAVAGPQLITMGLPPGRSLDGLELRLRPEERPVIFQGGAP